MAWMVTQTGSSKWWEHSLSLLFPLTAAALFYLSLSHEAARRVLALQTVENYGFAVFNQILWNFHDSGRFFQTIHRGYADSWMWSGHKAALLPLVGHLYGLRPGPIWLAQLQIGAVALGAFPAWGLGRRLLGHLLGGLVGLSLYFAYPALAFMALSDYQDIVLSIPTLLLALYASRCGSLKAFGATALLACAAREEVALLVALVGFGVSGGWRQRLTFGATGAGVAGLYLGGLYLLFHQDMAYESSAQTQLQAILTHLPALPPLRYDKLEALQFYLGFLKPSQWLGLFSPLTLLPGAGALGIHVLVNPDNGVDRVWTSQAHIHHLAPLIPLLVCASLETLAFGSRRIFQRFPQQEGKRPYLLLTVILSSFLFTLPAWSHLGLALHLDLTPKSREVSPVWALVAQIPAQASVATDRYASLAISSRAEAYTYDESLTEKIKDADPLSRLNYLIVHERDAMLRTIALSREGSSVVDVRGPYTLIRLK